MSALGLIAKVIPAEGAIKLAIAGGALLLAFAGGFYQGAARVEQRLQRAQLETTATVLQTERPHPVTGSSDSAPPTRGQEHIPGRKAVAFSPHPLSGKFCALFPGWRGRRGE